jgi:hypothetical protein
MMYPARTTRPKSIAQQIGNSMSQLSRRIDLDCSVANSEAQWPMMRTEGSFTKAPAVVPRPVASISQRSIMRMGETVFVPTRCTLIRCGMSEPVTRTVCSVTFSFPSWLALTGVSASEALVTIRAVTAAAMTLFTTQKYTRWLALQIAGPNTSRNGSLPRLPRIQRRSLELS